MRRYFLYLMLVLQPVSSAISAPEPGDFAERLEIDPGYSMLRLFLVDEHYLTAIRRVKSVLSFGGIHPDSARLIDEIAQRSETALRELEKHASLKPAIAFDRFEKNTIAISTFDALRYATARQLFLDSANFEKNLLLSQVQILPVISHLSQQLANNEIHPQRKQWLSKLNKDYSAFSKRTQNRLILADRPK